MILDAVEEQALITVTVHDIFWGYEDRFLRLAKDVLDMLHLKSNLITGTFGYYMGVSSFVSTGNLHFMVTAVIESRNSDYLLLSFICL